MTAVAYKATDPARIAAYMADRDAIEEKFNAACTAYEQKIGQTGLHGIAGYNGSFEVQGYTLETWNAEPAAGWRRERGTGRAVPAKKTPEGKAIAKELLNLFRPGRAYPGFPNMLFTNGYSLYPGVRQIGEDYFMTMSKVPREEDPATKQIDTELWQRVKLSEYFAALEEAGVAA